MELENLPQIQFTEKSAAEIELAIITLYESVSGRTLAKGDPVRLFLEAIALIIVQQRIIIDYTGKQNLLAYARDDNLDHIGVLVGTDRLPETAAMTTLRVTLSAVRQQNTTIPAGTRATAGGDIFFSIAETVIIPAGEQFADVTAVCTQTGETGNGYMPGEISKIVDPLPFVASIANTTKSEGGSGKEADQSFRERIRQAPESFSCAGPDGAYRYHAMRASVQIADVSVTSPRPAEVEIRPLLANGRMPGEEMLQAVREILDDRKIRPLSDKLTVLAPTPNGYAIDLTYYIDRENAAGAAAIQAAVEKAVEEYEIWQKSKLGRDVNPSELIFRIRAAGAKRVELRAPTYQATTKEQVSIAEKKTVLFGGLEDE